MDASAAQFPATRAEKMCAVLVGALLVVDSIWLLLAFGVRFTDEDQTIFWYAVREFASLRFREPFFYGQTYNTLFEAFPAAGLWLAGIPPWVGVPVVALSCGLLPWLLFAWIAWRKGARPLALLLLAGPLLLAPRYGMLLTLASYNGGVFFAAAGIACALAIEAPRARWLSWSLLTGVGLLANPSSALLAAPAALYLLLTHWRERELWLYGWIGFAAGALLNAAGMRFYRLHPAYNLHPPWPIEVKLFALGHGLDNLDRYFSMFAPLWAQRGALVLVLLAALFILALRTRRLEVIAPAASALLGVPLTLALTKMHDGTDSVYFSYSRAYVGLPLLLGLLAILVARPDSPARPKLRAFASLGVLVLAVAATATRALTMEEETMRQLQVPAMWVRPVATDVLLENCATMEDLSRRTGATLVVTLQDIPAAYGCGAVLYGRITVLFPQYDRRTWLLEEESRKPRERVLFADLFTNDRSTDFCQLVGPLATSCSIVSHDPDVAFVQMPPAPVTHLLRGKFGMRKLQ